MGNKGNEVLREVVIIKREVWIVTGTEAWPHAVTHCTLYLTQVRQDPWLHHSKGFREERA